MAEETKEEKQLDRGEVIGLFNALNGDVLKAKPISAATYLKLDTLIKDLRAFIKDLNESETKLAKDYNLNEGDPFPKDKTYREKLDAIHEKKYTPKELNFIPAGEIVWTESANSGFALIIREHLMKSE